MKNIVLLVDGTSQSPDSEVISNIATNGVKSLLIIAETTPVVKPAAILLNQLIAICEQTKCNKDAFRSLKKRLITFSQILSDLVKTIGGSDVAKNQSLNTCMANLVDVMSDAETELKLYCNAGYISHFLSGSKPQETFDGLDAYLTRNLNELSFALNVQSVKLQVEHYEMVCDIKNRVVDVGGDAKKLHDLAESFGADVNDLKNEIVNSLAEINETLHSGIGDFKVLAGQNSIVNDVGSTKLAVDQLSIYSLKSGIDQLLTSQYSHKSDVGSTELSEMIAQCPKLEPGQCVWDAESAKELGSGAYGKVYLGTYRGEAVAIKTIKNCRDQGALKNLLTEVCVHSEINHIPGVIRLYGADLTNIRDDKKCVVMELAAGSLHDAMYKHGPDSTLSLAIETLHSKLTIMCQVAHTVSALHELKILHGNLRPANILLCFSNGEVSAKLSDFGLAKHFEAHDQWWVGSLIFTAPELRQRKHISTASDVFAFGVTLNELLSKASFFEATKGLPLFSSEMNIKDDATEQLSEIIIKCLKTEQADRPELKNLTSQLAALRDRARVNFDREILNSLDVTQSMRIVQFVDLSSSQVAILFAEFGLNDVSAVANESRLSGKMLIDDFLGKSRKEIQALMKEDYDVDMHINTGTDTGCLPIMHLACFRL